MIVDVDGLILEYMSLSQSLAQQVWRTAPHALELDELIGIAHVGLVSAAKRWHSYCEAKGHDPRALQFFKPYVVRRVHGSMIDAIRQADYAGRSLRNRAKALQAAGQDKGVPEAELALRSGLTVKQVRATIWGMARRPVSIEGGEIDPVSTGEVEGDAFATDLLENVVGRIRDLDLEEQVVLTLHYFQGLQLRQIARTMGISESRASQLHARAVLAVHEQMVETARHRES